MCRIACAKMRPSSVSSPAPCRLPSCNPPDLLACLASGKVRENYAVGDDRILMIASDRLSAFDVIMGEPIRARCAAHAHGAVLVRQS